MLSGFVRWLAPARPKYTLEQFRNKDRVIELLRTLAEALVWSEQNKQDFFMYKTRSFFLEQEVTGHIKTLLTRQSDRTVALQLIQTISILSHNINTKASRSEIYAVYFHANNFLNDVISFPFDFADEEIAENFMSWLKGLATNLTVDMIQYYFTRGTCPILLQSQRFYNYPEPMTRTAARTVALCLFKTKHPEIMRLTIESAFFAHLICYFRQQWLSIDELIAAATGENQAKLQMALDEQIDNLYYLNDLCELEHSGLTNLIGEEVLRYLLLPLVAGSLGPSTARRTTITIQLALFMLAQVVTVLQHKAAVNGLVACVFLKEVSPALIQLCSGEVPAPPASFSYTYRPHDFVQPKAVSRDQHKFDALGEVMKVLQWASGREELQEMEENPVRREVLAFLRSKDDNLIMLTGLALQAVLTSQEVHSSVLTASGLLPQSVPEKSISEELEEPKDAGKPQRNSELIEQLLLLLCTDVPFRLSTTKLLCQLVLALAGPSLVPELSHYLNKALSLSIARVRTLIKKSFYSDLFIDIFEEEWEAVQKTDFSVKAQALVHYLMPMFEEGYSTLPLSERLPYGEIEAARRDTHAFFLVLKLRGMLMIGSQPVDCPVLFEKHTNWEIGKSYAMDDREFTRCVQKDGRDQFIRYFAEDPHYFILVTPDQNKTHWATISTITSLRNVEAMVDRSDPRVLVLAVKHNKDSLQLTLGFDSPQLVQRVKKQVDDHRKETKERGLRSAETLLQTLERQLVS